MKRFLATSSLATSLISPAILGLSRRLLALRGLIQALGWIHGITAFKNVASLHTKLASVVAVCLQVSPVACILNLNGILVDVRQAEYGESSGEDAKRRGNPERILGRGDLIVTAGCLDVGED